MTRKIRRRQSGGLALALLAALSLGGCGRAKEAKNKGAMAVAEASTKKGGVKPPKVVGRASIDAAAHMLTRVLDDNSKFTASHPSEHFAPFLNEQHPRATVVACSDSRFHDEAIDHEPDGDLFVIRNIGNQIDSAAGSVEYGIEHLHTPLLLIVGHVGCGAVKAALGDYGGERAPIRKELDGLHLSLREVQEKKFDAFEERWLAGVVGNVHQQVDDAMREYEAQVKKGELFVVGSVYDFRGDFGMRRGTLHVVNLNGERDVAKIYASPLLKRVADLGRDGDAAAPAAEHAAKAH
ncbi:MAG TPA: carbonic anhydrase [Polyangiaceae bacterium]|nr:carbonic anhydrase [Polyangiaceae bacterium]